MTSRNLVRLASRSVAATAPAIPSSSSSGGALSLSRAGGRPLRATSPPPPVSIASAACWESRTLCSDGEDWEEVVVAEGDADAPDALQETTEEHGVVFGVAPTDDEVRAAVASIKQ
jgi:hypothetical protein